MAERLPVVRQLSWIALIPQLVVLAAAVGLGSWLVPHSLGAALGALAYLACSLGLRWVLLGAHRRGFRQLQAGQYDQAVRSFEESYAFLSGRPWIDRFRWLTLLSPSAISYREMALVNLAYAHALAGRGTEAKVSYQRALREFPDSMVARSALKMFEVAERAAQAAAAPVPPT